MFQLPPFQLDMYLTRVLIYYNAYYNYISSLLFLAHFLHHSIKGDALSFLHHFASQPSCDYPDHLGRSLFQLTRQSQRNSTQILLHIMLIIALTHHLPLLKLNTTFKSNNTSRGYRVKKLNTTINRAEMCAASCVSEQDESLIALTTHLAQVYLLV